jgi:UDP-N-acetyl-D-glucosamine dehydrogenase
VTATRPEMEGLPAAGASVSYHDPHAPEVRLGDRVLRSADPTGVGADLVIAHTLHQAMDLAWPAEDQLVLDATYRLRGPGRRVAL